mmetsp:Transcript_71786/g.138730  ORF Transcript_71786/g.138730 Transcript_71786/m.138730 type:complete len:138 (+) Transcript_71786:3-416(+)
MRDNPFPFFFWRGLNVTLSTDDPLMFHTTNEPLLEEYTAAKLVWGLSACDLSEIAANSVRQSGFADSVQREALGEEALSREPYRWDPNCCNMPERRLRFRRRCLAEELNFIAVGDVPPAPPPEPRGDLDWTVAQLPD